MTEECEFGKGLTYCLGMFLAHQEKVRALEAAYKKAGVSDMTGLSWFNGASDHLYDLVIPQDFPHDLRKRLEEFQNKCLHWGHGFPEIKGESAATIDDVWWSLNEAKELLRLIDRHFGIDAVKGEWQ